MKNYETVNKILKGALERYDESNKDLEEVKRVIRAKEFMIENKLKEDVNGMIDYLKGKAVNKNIIKFIPTVSNFVDNKLAAKVLMEITPIVELEVGDKITKEIKALSHKHNEQEEVIVLRYESLLDGYHYTEYTLIIVIEDDTIARIQIYTMNKQI